jgi:hypothetical protein
MMSLSQTIASILGSFKPKIMVHTGQHIEVEDCPVIEMVTWSTEDPGAKEHLRLTGDEITFCGSDCRTWNIVGFDGRLLAGKECYECLQAHWRGSAFSTLEDGSVVLDEEESPTTQEEVAV